jgi:glutamine amidotransferase
MTPLEVVVIDYGAGNLLSVQRAFEQCGARVYVTAEPNKILAASRVVLPGVGAFRNGMYALEKLGLVETLQELAFRKTPLLGICLGMQLLLEVSEEFGVTKGLGLIEGRVIPVPNLTSKGSKLKIPHIGWSALNPSQDVTNWNKTLMKNNRSGEAAYFVHSFMAVPTNPAHRIADCLYGGNLIAATIGAEQITGCQFHPEKSGEVGLKILRNFCSD